MGLWLWCFGDHFNPAVTDLWSHGKKNSSLLLWLCWFLTFIWVLICLALGLFTCLKCEIVYTGWSAKSLDGSSDPSCGAGCDFVTILSQSWRSPPWFSHQIMIWANLFLVIEWNRSDLLWGSVHCPMGHDTKQGSGPCPCSKIQHSLSPSTRLMSFCQNQLLSLKLCHLSWKFLVSSNVAAWWGSLGTSSWLWIWATHPC